MMYYGPGMGAWGYLLMTVNMLLFWGLVIAGIVVLVRYVGTNKSATGIFNFRIDADYQEPLGGFRPVRVTYAWEEDGQPKRDVHVARGPQETYTIRCAAKPLMKSVVLELAE